MVILEWLAGFVFFLQLPIPLYWFVVHPQIGFWRRHRRAVFIAGLALSWPPVTASMILFHRELIDGGPRPVVQIAAGAALIAFEVWIFWRVKRDLGGARLVGATELSGGGEIARSGIYARIRHPRYLGSFLAIVGACLVAGTRAAWVVVGVWACLMLAAIFLEEREMRARFGDVFEEYRRRVPRFFPLRTWQQN